MGGRKGYSLKKIVGDIRKVKTEQKQLLSSIRENDPKKLVKASAKILAKSDNALESLVYSYLFVDSIKDDYQKLSAEGTKERRKELAKKWADFRKEKDKTFDPTTNRDIVDSATRVLGGGK